MTKVYAPGYTAEHPPHCRLHEAPMRQCGHCLFECEACANPLLAEMSSRLAKIEERLAELCPPS